MEEPTPPLEELEHLYLVYCTTFYLELSFELSLELVVGFIFVMNVLKEILDFLDIALTAPLTTKPGPEV